MKSSIHLPALAPFYPGIVTSRFFETWDFYTTHLGFGTVEESNRRLRLVHESGVQLEILREETDGEPAELIPAAVGRGFWFTLAVGDAQTEHARLMKAGVELAWECEEIADERRFAVRDPNGVLIFIVQKLPSNRHHRSGKSNPLAA